MFIIGAHLSSSKGYTAMLRQAQKIGANTFQFFTRNPRGGSAKAIDEEDINTFLCLMKSERFPIILAHAPYTLNCCSAKPETREFALNTFADDLKRMEYTPGQLYNFHPGSHVGQGVDRGVELIAETLNKVLFEDMTTTVLLETMAGKGSEIGRTFQELKTIMDRTQLSDKLGVCLDTCHVFDGGYDIVNALDRVLDEFDKIVGMERLKAVHLNDSKNTLGSHKDRHEKIGEGNIGAEAFGNIINHPQLRNLPFYLETPNEIDGYAREIAFLKTLYNE